MTVTKLMIVNLIKYYAMFYGINPAVPLTIAEIESQYDHSITGTKGEIGVMQLLPTSFPEYTPRSLKSLETNVKLGVGYLAYVKKHCAHQRYYTWVVCYNYGVSGGSKLKYPKETEYYKRFMEVYGNSTR